MSENGLWELNTVQQTWTLVIPHGRPGSPPARYLSGKHFAEFGSDLYLFGGGVLSDFLYNDLWRLRQTTIQLLATNVTNPIIAYNPFNLTWKVNTTSGSHNALVMLDGKNYTQLFNTTDGWMTFNISSNISNFSLELFVSDLFDQGAIVRQVIPFYRK